MSNDPQQRDSGDGDDHEPSIGTRRDRSNKTFDIEQRTRQAVPVGHSRFLPSMLVLLFVLLMMLIVPHFSEKISYRIARGRQNAARDELQQLTPTRFSNTSRLVAEAVERSVVYIGTRGLVGSNSRIQQEAAGQGSGVIVDEEGYVLTNFHVVVGATQIVVHLGDGRQKLADVVGVDEYTDLAVLKIDADGLLAAKWGDSDELQPGDPVWAIGSPYGLDNSVTFGIVSAKGRNGVGLTRYEDLLQTDAAVNPGNSGGALVNAKGELVGINTAIVGDAYRGISFAMPSNMAREVFGKLKNDDAAPRGYLGVTLDKVSSRQAEAAGIVDGKGAVVTNVFANSPAAAAGLLKDDIIVRWQRQVVKDPRHLSSLVSAAGPTTAAEIVLIRDGKRVTVEIKVGRFPKTLR